MRSTCAAGRPHPAGAHERVPRLRVGAQGHARLGHEPGGRGDACDVPDLPVAPGEVRECAVVGRGAPRLGRGASRPRRAARSHVSHGAVRAHHGGEEHHAGFHLLLLVLGAHVLLRRRRLLPGGVRGVEPAARRAAARRDFFDRPPARAAAAAGGVSYARTRASTASAPAGRARAYALMSDPNARSSGATPLASIFCRTFSARTTSPWPAQWSIRLVYGDVGGDAQALHVPGPALAHGTHPAPRPRSRARGTAEQHVEDVDGGAHLVPLHLRQQAPLAHLATPHVVVDDHPVRRRDRAEMRPLRSATRSMSYFSRFQRRSTASASRGSSTASRPAMNAW